MKKLLSCIALIGSLLALMPAEGQTQAPPKFIKRGFVQNIDFEDKLILVNFVPDTDKKTDDYEIASETLELKDPQITNSKNEKLSLKDLKSSEEITVEGDLLGTEKFRHVSKVTISEIKVKPITGRIDFIDGDFAYVNGNKIKLKSGKAIKGEGKFSGKTYNSINDIGEGNFADVDGKYSSDGFFLASGFAISPEDETKYDKSAMELEKENYEKFYSDWIDKTKRKKLFGTEIKNLGKITNDAVLQEYVNTVGLKLVPAHIKKKINFIFIVVDNPDLLAYVRANGLAYVCTGLLRSLENEAQLATVLGHEISHAIYEHQAEDAANTEKKEKNKEKTNKFAKGAWTALQKAAVAKDYKNGRGKVSEETQDKTAEKAESNKVVKDNLVDLTNSYADKRSSDYNVDQEFQADRVGLCLMVMAGYDPREAPIVWKNIFDRYGIRTPPKEGKELKETWVEEMKDPNSDTGKKPANIFVKWKTDDYKAKSTKTHPEEIKRFEELNRLIALYWNNTELLAKTDNGEAKYIEMKRRIKRG